jgi:SAM-dependent methyltransferase
MRDLARVVVRTEKEVAYNSPDYLMPWGTRRDNSRNLRFNQKLYRLYPRHTDFLKVLDLGCSGGGAVRDFLNDGCLAVGLEGSDYSKKSRRAEWATIPDYLFTCDITAPFEVLQENGQVTGLIQFDVVTSWDVIEHIAEYDLSRVAENVKKHLQPGGLWILSISPNEEVINGVRLHQTVHAKSWWVEKFRSFGLEHMEKYVQYFNTQYIRGPKYGAPGSFHLTLSPDSSLAPPIPHQKTIEMLYDRWLGSKPQRALKQCIVGI